MDGLLFYWFFWLGWIVTTFFYPKTHPERLIVSAWILVVILLSTTTLNVVVFEMSAAGLFIILTMYLYAATLQIKKLLYFFLSSFILMLTTVCFLLFELFDPIWVWIEREWLLAILVTIIVVLLQSDKKQRILIMLLGMIQGELFYSLILMKYSFSNPVATLYSLDAVAGASAFLVAWNGFEWMARYFEKYLYSIEKEKQKLT
ncbi:hypothetical protein JMM81_02590 [Bacillus sp. V3B]|uniref:YphA family membrane protein n=1 Tax=Bacillus sp. V3B TaxID=2804915 RepID=UPI00210A1E2E|nr:hypothetical protein [Bacillus sp. V3B]MCQ6273865.1 hypothetical protein [Bacillus sp. V3B]